MLSVEILRTWLILPSFSFLLFAGGRVTGKPKRPWGVSRGQQRAWGCGRPGVSDTPWVTDTSLIVQGTPHEAADVLPGFWVLSYKGSSKLYSPNLLYKNNDLPMNAIWFLATYLLMVCHFISDSLNKSESISFISFLYLTLLSKLLFLWSFI